MQFHQRNGKGFKVAAGCAKEWVNYASGMAAPFPDPEHRISVNKNIKLLFFIRLYFSYFTELHKITHLK